MSLTMLRAGGYGGTAAPNVPSPVTDTLAPTEITNFRVDEAVDELIWSWDQSADLYASTAAAGIDVYPFDRDASVTNIAAPATNVRGELTYLQIGSDSITPTFARSGNDITIVSSGVGIGQTADEFGFAYVSRTGDFKLKCKIHSFTGTPIYAQCGLHMRESTAAGSKFVTFCQLSSAESRGIQALWRATINTAFYTSGGGFLGTATGVDGPVWITAERVGNVFTFEYSFTNAPDSWESLGSHTLSLSSTLLIGGFCCANDFGDFPCTAVLRDLCWVPPTRVTVTQAVSFPTTVVGKVRAKDLAANQAAYTSTLTGAPLEDAPPPTDYIGWHPGAYYQIDFPLGRPSLNASQWVNVEAAMDAAVTEGMRGVQAWLWWGACETIKGDFAGLQEICGRLYNEAAERGIYVMLHLVDRTFHPSAGALVIPTTPQTGSRFCHPDYLIDEGYIVISTVDGIAGTVQPKMWNITLIGYEIELWRQVAIHADAHPNGDRLECIETAETTFVGTADYTALAYRTQMTRMVQEVAPFFPHTLKSLCANSWPSNDFSSGTYQLTDFRAVCDAAVAAGWGMSGPDLYNLPGTAGENSWGEKYTRGEGIIFFTGAGYSVNYGTPDKRGVIGPIMVHDELPHDDIPEMLTWAATGIRNTHFVFNPSAGHDIPTVMALWRARGYGIAGPNSGCPSSFGGLCSV